jgi:AcrR family transcriptional regulator
MTVASRKQREKEEMRQLILDAARKLFLEKGFEQASIRNIAEQIEYSPGTIYLYFKEKDEIFFALHEEGFTKLLESMAPLQFVADPFERLKAMGRIYMEFAKNNKDFYDLMFIMGAPMNVKEKGDWAMGESALEHLKTVLRDCQAGGRFQGMDIEHLSFMVWSAMHGMCALYCRERCAPYDQFDPVDLMDHSYELFISILNRL